MVFGVPITDNGFNWSFRNRAFLVGQVVNWLMRDGLPVWVEDCPEVGPIYYEDPQTGEGLLAIINASLDKSPLRLHTRLKLNDLFRKNKVSVISDSIPGMGILFFRTSLETK